MNMRPVRLAPCAAGASPSDEQPRGRVAEAGHGRPQYVLVAEGRALLARDLLAPLHEPGAAAARDHRLIERGQRGHGERAYP